MSLTLYTAPTEYPITLGEAKDHLRVDSTDYDDEIQAMISEGTSYIEDIVGYKLITQTWKYITDAFNKSIKLPIAPLQSVTSITYKDTSNVSQTLSSSYYIVDTSSIPARINQAYGYTYPDTYTDINSVTVTFVCGYGDAGDVPEVFKRAIKLYCQYAFDSDKDALDMCHTLIMKYKIDWFALV